MSPPSDVPAPPPTLEQIIVEAVRRAVREELAALKQNNEPRMLRLADVAGRDLGWSPAYSAIMARTAKVPGAVRRGRRWFVASADWAAYLATGRSPRDRAARSTVTVGTVFTLADGVEAAVRRSRSRSGALARRAS